MTDRSQPISSATDVPPRYCQRAFPPYSYVPGSGTPHPVSDPRGHMAQVAEEAPAPWDPNLWHSSETYLYAVDLFNHGYYWEAHESWEALWHAAGRTGPAAAFLKGLIKLAAAGVKSREGNPRGVARHAGRAAELLGSVLLGSGDHQDQAPLGTYGGVDLQRMRQACEQLAADPASTLNRIVLAPLPA